MGNETALQFFIFLATGKWQAIKCRLLIWQKPIFFWSFPSNNSSISMSEFWRGWGEKTQLDTSFQRHKCPQTKLNTRKDTLFWHSEDSMCYLFFRGHWTPCCSLLQSPWIPMSRQSGFGDKSNFIRLLNAIYQPAKPQYCHLLQVQSYVNQL